MAGLGSEILKGMFRAGHPSMVLRVTAEQLEAMREMDWFVGGALPRVVHPWGQFVLEVCDD